MRRSTTYLLFFILTTTTMTSPLHAWNPDRLSCQQSWPEILKNWGQVLRVVPLLLAPGSLSLDTQEPYCNTPTHPLRVWKPVYNSSDSNSYRSCNLLGLHCHSICAQTSESPCQEYELFCEAKNPSPNKYHANSDLIKAEWTPSGLYQLFVGFSLLSFSTGSALWLISAVMKGLHPGMSESSHQTPTNYGSL